jgi:exonuclease III
LGKVHKILCEEAGFLDTWEHARDRNGKIEASFHGFSGKASIGRIDWILFRSRYRIQVEEATFVEFEDGGVFPSDHFPYFVTFSIHAGS